MLNTLDRLKATWLEAQEYAEDMERHADEVAAQAKRALDAAFDARANYLAAKDEDERE